MLNVPVPEEVLAVIVVVPWPTNWAAPVAVSVKLITPELLELQAAVTLEPFAEAVKSIVPPAACSADRL